MMSRPEVPRTESRLLAVLFGLAVAYSLYAVTFNWTKGFLPGHEFRQAQTALITYYIDRDDNFSLRYETPVLGKPWVSILLEVPLYEWTVVLVSRATGLPHYLSARGVTAACFYLTLPALYLLLGRLGLAPPRRLFVLALVLVAPVYVFYSRAFLMDSMALMFSAWWLLGFVRAMDERRWPGLLLAVVAGTGAALVKSATWAAWLPVGAAYGAWLLGRDLRARRWRAAAATAGWGLATVAVALGALRAWIAFSDPIKAAHASAWIFTSKNLSQGNWGLFDPRPLFSAETWRNLLGGWELAIMSRWVIAATLLAGLVRPRGRGPVLGLAGAFLCAQAMFPNAYAYQDYYFYSCTIFLLGALGFALLGLFDTRGPRWVIALVLLVPFAAQVGAYWRGYRVGQAADLPGGTPLTEALREQTPAGSVIVIAGDDWSAITPYYAQRKALMIRNGLEYDPAYLRRAFADLDGEEVSALVLYGDLRTNRDVLGLAAARLEIDPRAPVFSYREADVYGPRARSAEMRARLARAHYPEVIVAEAPPAAPAARPRVDLRPGQVPDEFKVFQPLPFQADFQFGLGWMGPPEHRVLSSHPDASLWVRPPPDASRIVWRFGVFDGAYTDPAEQTDGVDFTVTAESPEGGERRLFRRVLEPGRNVGDRGEQEAVIAYRPRPGEVLRFSTGPYDTPRRDWAYIARIRVE